VGDEHKSCHLNIPNSITTNRQIMRPINVYIPGYDGGGGGGSSSWTKPSSIVNVTILHCKISYRTIVLVRTIASVWMFPFSRVEYVVFYLS
jgi:hypothetical protein